MVEQKYATAQKLVKSKRASYNTDCASKPLKKKRYGSEDEFRKEDKTKVKRRVQVKPELQTSAEERGKKKGVDVWAEVFIEEEERWISVDVTKGKVHCVSELYVSYHPCRESPSNFHVATF